MDFFSWPYSESDISKHHQKFGGQFDEKNHCFAIFGKSKTYLETRNINLILKALSFPNPSKCTSKCSKTCVYIFFQTVKLSLECSLVGTIPTDLSPWKFWRHLF